MSQFSTLAKSLLRCLSGNNSIFLLSNSISIKDYILLNSIFLIKSPNFVESNFVIFKMFPLSSSLLPNFVEI